MIQACGVCVCVCVCMCVCVFRRWIGGVGERKWKNGERRRRSGANGEGREWGWREDVKS